MKAIDLFCGIGGFHYAAKENGIEIVFASEIDKHAREQYKLNHGLEPFGDITKIDAKDIPDHDILFAGFPCQSFSIAGSRKGFQDVRGTLFFEIERILGIKRPKYFLLENVKGLISHEGGNTLKTIENALYGLGYFLHIKVLNAKYFGVPQNRERIFIAGFRNKDNYNNFRFPNNQAVNTCVSDILEKEVDEKYFIQKENQIKKIKKDLNKKFSIIDPDIGIAMTARQYANGRGNYLNPKKIGYIKTDSQSTRIYDCLFSGVTLCTNGGGLGAKTGLYQVEDKIRKLTPRECARMQGFPESYKIECSDNQAYKQFGNSVAVPCVSAIIREIIKNETVC